MLAAASGAGGCAVVPSGSAAIVVAADGSREREGEGAHLVSPLAQVELFDLRDQERNEEMSALTSDGAPLDARAAVVTYHLLPDELDSYAREVEADCFEVLVKPIVRSTVRRVLAERRFADLTTDGIRAAQAEVTRIARERLRPHHVALDEVLLKGVILAAPQTEAAILSTAACEQEALAIPSTLALARSRAEALRAQARAITDAHALVGPSLTAGVLADEEAKAWCRLLAASSSSVVFLVPSPSRSSPAIVEVKQ
jgi:regulator of protease activity HflC (stomatin/prohibitin superfamily)